MTFAAFRNLPVSCRRHLATIWTVALASMVLFLLSAGAAVFTQAGRNSWISIPIAVTFVIMLISGALALTSLKGYRLVPVPEWSGVDTYSALLKTKQYMSNRGRGRLVANRFVTLVQIGHANGIPTLDQFTAISGEGEKAKFVNPVDLMAAVDGLVKVINHDSRIFPEQHQVSEELAEIRQILEEASIAGVKMSFQLL